MREMYHKASPFDAVVSTAGPAALRPFEDLADDDFRQALTRKLMGQVNLVRLGMERINDNGSFTLTSGVLGRNPVPGSVVASTVNAAIEGFVRAAGTEMPRGVRLNAVSPVWVKETLESMGLDPRPGVSAADTARVYVEAVEGSSGAEVLEVPDFV
jgi:NAD(P)-dependent dehydrogenase (short-subunit alcohol dehydrogenase family)